jgi:hypothetical protein
MSDGEFGWGGTTARLQRSCPKVSFEGKETTHGAEGQKLALGDGMRRRYRKRGPIDPLLGYEER